MPTIVIVGILAFMSRINELGMKKVLHVYVCVPVNLSMLNNVVFVVLVV